jgi:trans-aconitate methyltransferase
MKMRSNGINQRSSNNTKLPYNLSNYNSLDSSPNSGHKPAMAIICHSCGSDNLTDIAGYSVLPRVASDCRPWRAGGILQICRGCGLVQKRIDDAWRAEAQEIYSSYKLYHQTDGREQAVFEATSGSAVPRSRKVLDQCQAQLGGLLGTTGAMLDFGCGTGAMLRAFSDVSPADWQLYGFDPSLKDDRPLLAIPKVSAVYTGSLAEIEPHVAFEVITLSHVLEHVEHPVDLLATLRRKLATNGRIIVEVPYFSDNPIDLLVADHATHFTAETLEAVLKRAGLEPLLVSTDIIAKELTAVAQPNSQVAADTVAVERGGTEVVDLVQRRVAWLERAIAQARSASAARPFGVFGTSIGASWILGSLDDHVDFFVDEDKGRVGTSFFGHPVLGPSEVPPSAEVFMAMVPAVATAILDRLAPMGRRRHVLPQLT